MRARARGIELLSPAMLAAAALLGLLAAISPPVAVAAMGALVLAYVVFADLALGVAIFAFLTFLDTLPTSGALSLAKGAGLLIAVAWLARFSSSDRGGERDFFVAHPHLTWVLVAFLGWGAVSLLWATQTGTGLTALSRYAPNVLLLPIVYTAARTRRDLLLALGAIVLGATVAAGFGLLQPPDPNLVQESTRATGTIGDPNELAAVLLVGLSLGAAFAVARGSSPLMRAISALAVPLCAAGVFLSLSRGGLVALGVLLLAGTVFAGRWRLAITLLLVAVVAGGVLYYTQLAPLPAREHVESTGTGTGRTDLWTVGWRMVQAHPFTGVGIGNFSVVSADYALQPGSITRPDLIFSSAPKITHNTYLQVLSEEGIPGLALFLITIATCMAAALKSAKLWARSDDAGMEALARAVFLGLVGMLAADFFISNMFSKLLWLLFALCPAMLAIARLEARRARPSVA
jgi:O-antigen ligase